MELEDLKLISKLIHKYGIKEIEHIAEINSVFLSYMGNKNSRFFENGEYKIFTNLESSIFILKPELIDFDVLKTNNNNSFALPTSLEEMQKYISNAENLMGNYPTFAKYLLGTSNEGYIYGSNSDYMGLRTISLEDYKMINLLLSYSDIQVSRIEPIVKFENDKGKAYVLGKNTFRTIF